jgi:hypothetical protein
MIECDRVRYREAETMSEKAYVKHVKTGEVFEVDFRGDDYCSMWDDKGEQRVFKREMLTPYEPEEAWEDCVAGDVGHTGGYLKVWVMKNGKPEQLHVPSPYTRTITRDGKLVVQRRRA